MRCSRVRKIILQSPPDALPEAIRMHAEECARCGVVLARTRRVCGLIHLKVYERPDPGAQDRCLAELRDRIALHQAWRGAEQDAASEHALGWRFGVAAAFIAFLAVNAVTNPSFSPAPTTAAGHDLSAPAARQALAAGGTGQEEYPSMQALFASNRVNRLHVVPEPSARFYFVSGH